MSPFYAVCLLLPLLLLTTANISGQCWATEKELLHQRATRPYCGKQVTRNIQWIKASLNKGHHHKGHSIGEGTCLRPWGHADNNFVLATPIFVHAHQLKLITFASSCCMEPWYHGVGQYAISYSQYHYNCINLEIQYANQLVKHIACICHDGTPDRQAGGWGGGGQCPRASFCLCTLPGLNCLLSYYTSKEMNDNLSKMAGSKVYL